MSVWPSIVTIICGHWGHGLPALPLNTPLRKRETLQWRRMTLIIVAKIHVFRRRLNVFTE